MVDDYDDDKVDDIDGDDEDAGYSILCIKLGLLKHWVEII